MHASRAARPRRSAVFVLLAGVAAAACGEDEDPLAGCGTAVERIELASGDTLVLRGIGVSDTLRPAFVDACGADLDPGGAQVSWSSSAPEVVSVEPVPGAEPPAGIARAVGEGRAVLGVSVGTARAELPVRVEGGGSGASAFTLLGQAEMSLSTTDLWAHGDYLYNGSQPWACPGTCEGIDGWVFTWRLEDGGGFVKVDSVAVPAAKINDVKVSADGSFAVASQELGAPGDNGIVILDLADPASPTVLTRYGEELEGGVHNVWIERIGGRDYVFVVEDGSGTQGGLHVVDVTDRRSPEEVAYYYAGSSIVHDVYVRDGLAFVSHWNAGLVILDVGSGIAGGSPAAPVEVGRVVTEGGRVHNAWYWPEGRKVFVGEERFAPPDRPEEVGVMHVVDVSDPKSPVEVARFGVPGNTPHNFWLDEERSVLFMAWYTEGVRALDVSGTLSGDLAAQGRELGWLVPDGARPANIWAPQLHRGLVYLSDIDNGLWSARFEAR